MLRIGALVDKIYAHS